MSTPEPHNRVLKAVEPLVQSTEAVTRYEDPTGPTRTTRASSWLGYHLAEVAGVSVPLVLTFTVSDWFAIGSGVAALLWAAHEYRTHRRQEALRTGHDTSHTTEHNDLGTGGHDDDDVA